MTIPKYAFLAIPIALALPLAPALLGALGVEDAATPAVAAAAPTFRVSDSGSSGSELNLGVTSNGMIFVGGWDVIARSADDGLTWDHISYSHVPGPASVGFAADRVLIVDHDTDRVFVSDTNLACTLLGWSDDYGATWSHNEVACGGGVTDHQKVGVGKRVTLTDPTGTLYPNLIYVCANGLAAANCGVSADGGLTFLPTNQHGVGCAFQGAPVGDLQGRFWEPTTQCGAQVRVTANNGLTWTALPVDGASPSRDTPDMAVTPDGTVYFFYTDSNWQPVFQRSTDGGFTWSAPIAVPVPGLTSSVFPSIVAGDDGRIALSFYGTTDDAEGWNHNPGSAPSNVEWHGYVAIVTDAAAETPTVAPQAVTGILETGGVSKLDGLHDIADYMDIDVGPDGRVYAVFVESHNGGHTKGVVAIQMDGDDLKA